jgi:glycosyltransferase involved in cell wall biosynthesis
VLDEASAVVAVSPLVQQEFQAMTQTHVELITNGFDECDFEGPDATDMPGQDSSGKNGVSETGGTGTSKSHLAAGGPDKEFVITHTGLFAADGDPTVLWKVLGEKCSSDETFRKALRIKLVGKTDEKILESIKAEDLEDKVENMGYQPHAEAIAQQRQASLLILPLRKEPEYKAVLPGKLFEYLASWRPVLGIGQPDGAMSMILNTTRTGVVLDWKDKTSIARFIELCWKNHLEGRLTVDDADISQFTRRNLTRRMAELFDRLTK